MPPQQKAHIAGWIQGNGQVSFGRSYYKTSRFLQWHFRTIWTSEWMVHQAQKCSWAHVMISVHRKGNRPPVPGGRIFGSLFFLAFFGMGALFCCFIAREFYLNVQTRTWRPTECVVVESHIQQKNSRDDNPYEFVVHYEYAWQGQEYSSTNCSRQPACFSDYSKAQRLASRYPSDTKAKCFVDPSHPEHAVLEKPSLWIGLVILLPLFFIGIGVGGLLMVWEFKPLMARLPLRASGAPSSGGRRKSAAFQAVLFSLFLLVGSSGLYFLTLHPLQRMVSARHWKETECTIISSRVRRHSGNKGPTYAVDILYAYQVAGREFRSNRYKFLGGSSSGRRGKAAIVQRFRAGTKAICFVNPEDPFEAVLNRGFTPDMWFGLIPGVFFLIGTAGLLPLLRR